MIPGEEPTVGVYRVLRLGALHEGAFESHHAHLLLKGLILGIAVFPVMDGLEAIQIVTIER